MRGTHKRCALVRVLGSKALILKRALAHPREPRLTRSNGDNEPRLSVQRPKPKILVRLDVTLANFCTSSERLSDQARICTRGPERRRRAGRRASSGLPCAQTQRLDSSRVSPILSGSPCEPRSGERKRLTNSAPSASTLFCACARALRLRTTGPRPKIYSYPG